MFDAGKTRMIGTVKKTDDMLSRFHLIPEHHGQTDGRMDRQTDRQRFAISISRVSVLTRDKNCSASSSSAHKSLLSAGDNHSGRLAIYRNTVRNSTVVAYGSGSGLRVSASFHIFTLRMLLHASNHEG